MSDRVAVMRAGVLEQVGTPEDVYRYPVSALMADFVGVANRFAGTIKGAVEAGRYRRGSTGARRVISWPAYGLQTALERARQCDGDKERSGIPAPDWSHRSRELVDLVGLGGADEVEQKIGGNFTCAGRGRRRKGDSRSREASGQRGR